MKVFISLLVVLFLGLNVFSQTTTRVSVDSNGIEADWHSSLPSISADGRYVAFESIATNLVPGDTNFDMDIFVNDQQTGKTTRVSVDSQGNQGLGIQGVDISENPSISADGRYVVFGSYDINLVPGDTNLAVDIFVHDQQTEKTTRVSVSSNGSQGNSSSEEPSISGDGRYVAFWSSASNLVPGDTNGKWDVFLHDQQTGETTRVSVDSQGNEANGHSFGKTSISADGRYIAFQSSASNLVPNDTNGLGDVFVHDCQTGETTRLSIDSNGNQGNNSSSSSSSSISANGKYVAFSSSASNLVPNDTNGATDTFVHNRETGGTTRVSIDSNGNQGNSFSNFPSMSADGRYVAFTSNTSNLISNDTNGKLDVFVHDRQTGGTTRVSVDSNGNQGNNASYSSSISADSRYVAFISEAFNLVPNDTNGSSDVFVHSRFQLSGTVLFEDGLTPVPDV
ncbi:MAG: hypothetical protein AAB407_00365, partial [Patescibacteria group bacterium]